MFDPVTMDGPPGPALAAAVATCDLDELTDEQKLQLAAAGKRLAAWSEAMTLQAVASFAADRNWIRAGCSAAQRSGGVRMLRFGGDGTPEVEEFTPEVLAVALNIAPTTAQSLVGHALDLTHRFPAVATALARGDTDGFRAKIITNTTRRLDADAAIRVEAAVMPRLGRVTTRQLEKLVAAETIAADRAGADRSEQVARTAKGVWTSDSYPGLTSVSAELDADAAARLDQQIDTVARLLRRTGRVEPWQELRADALGMLADPTAITRLQHSPEDGESDGEPLETSSESAHAAGLPRTMLYLHRTPDGKFDLEGCGPITDQQAGRILSQSQVTIKPVIDLNNLVEAPPAARLATSPRPGFAKLFS